MSVVFWVLLSVLGGAVAFIVVAVATPIIVDLRLHASPKVRFDVTARLFGGLTPPIQLHSSARPDKSKKVTQKREDEAREHKAWSGFARGPEFLTTAVRLFVDVLRPIHVDHLTLDADFGLGDPADTGHLYGMLTPVMYAIPPTPAVSISLRPDFATARISGDAIAGFRFVPAALVPPAARLAWHVFGRHS